MLKLCWVMLAVLVVGKIIGYNCEREPSKEHFLKVWSLLARQFQRKRFLNIFLIESFVKTMSADSAILVGSRGHQIQSSKGTIQRTFYQSLVPTGHAVSEEHILKHFSYWDPMLKLCRLNQ